MIQSSMLSCDQISLYANSLRTLRKKDPKLSNLRANVKISFFESFSSVPLLLKVQFSPLSVRSKKHSDESEDITIWGKQLEEFCLQIKTSCEMLIKIITRCNDQESFNYVQNYVSSNGNSIQNERLNNLLKEYDTDISFSDKMKFNIEANIMRYNIREKDKEKFAIESRKTTIVRKIIYKDFIKPLLSIYQQVHRYQIQGDIVIFNFRSGNYMPSITNIREFIPPNGLNENLYYTCYKMYNLFLRGNNINSYDFYRAMNTLYQQFLNNASQVSIQTLAVNKLHNLDQKNIENELKTLQMEIMSPHIQPKKFIDSYRIIALAFIHIAINGHGTNTFKDVNVLGIDFLPNILSQSQNQMIFHLKTFKENFLDKIASTIKENFHKIEGPSLIGYNFDSDYNEVLIICKKFSVSKRSEYELYKKEYNKKRKELENLLLSKEIASFGKKASQSEAESFKNQINNSPFSFLISDGMISCQLGSFYAKVNFGVIIHFRQKFSDLKIIFKKKEKMESIIKKLDIQDSIISLYEDTMSIKDENKNIAIEIDISRDEGRITTNVNPIKIPKYS